MTASTARQPSAAALRRYAAAVRGAEFTRRSGKVSQFFGLVVESIGPDVFLGEVCEIHSRSNAAPIDAEVVGLQGPQLADAVGGAHRLGLDCEVGPGRHDGGRAACSDV